MAELLRSPSEAGLSLTGVGVGLTAAFESAVCGAVMFDFAADGRTPPDKAAADGVALGGTT